MKQIKTVCLSIAVVFIFYSKSKAQSPFQWDLDSYHEYPTYLHVSFESNGLAMGEDFSSGRVRNLSSSTIRFDIRFTIIDFCGNSTTEYMTGGVSLKPGESNSSTYAITNRCKETKKSGQSQTGIASVTCQVINFKNLTEDANKKNKETYDALINEADNLYNKGSLLQAEQIYIKAKRNALADDYPEIQLQTIRKDMADKEKKQSYDDNIKNAEHAETIKDYSTAKNYYKAALATGVNDTRSEMGIRKADSNIAQLKREQEEAMQKDNEIKEQKKFLAKKEKEAEEAAKKIDETLEDLEKQNKKEVADIVKDLDEEQRKEAKKALQSSADEMRKAIASAAEAKEKRKKEEKLARRAEDQNMIDVYKKNMQYDPYLYKEYTDKADSYRDEGNAINPYSVLELEKKWWDLNPYMESFRDDVNEPRRKEAWEKSHDLLYEMLGKYAIAKDYYTQAIAYCDPESKQYYGLLSEIDLMNFIIDLQKERLEKSGEQEQNRQKYYFQAKQNKIVAAKQNNQLKASLLYSATTQGASYGVWNTNPELRKGMEEQMDFERRADQADQQLKQDNLVTGVSTQIVTSTLLNNDLENVKYHKNDIGINAFTNSGFAGYPVVSNYLPKAGYVTETHIRNLNIIPIGAGATLWLHRGKFWNLGYTADAIFGVLPMKGSTNVFVSYGSNLKFDMGYKRVKLAFEADKHKRIGSYYYDQDVALAELGNPYQQPTNVIEEGEFNYSVLKVGGGLHIDISDSTEDGYIRLLMYAEKPSFYTNFNFKKPILSFGGQVVFKGGITLGFEMSQNYPAAGKAENVISEYKGLTMFRGYFGKTWTLGKTNW